MHFRGCPNNIGIAWFYWNSNFMIFICMRIKGISFMDNLFCQRFAVTNWHVRQWLVFKKQHLLITPIAKSNIMLTACHPSLIPSVLFNKGDWLASRCKVFLRPQNLSKIAPPVLWVLWLSKHVVHSNLKMALKYTVRAL